MKGIKLIVVILMSFIFAGVVCKVVEVIVARIEMFLACRR